ncbi:hypothetical protein R6Q59_035639 [Mikania micrantha]
MTKISFPLFFLLLLFEQHFQKQQLPLFNPTSLLFLLKNTWANKNICGPFSHGSKLTQHMDESSELRQLFVVMKKNGTGLEGCLAFEKEGLQDFQLKREADNRKISVEDFVSEELITAAEKSQIIISPFGEKLLLNEDIVGNKKQQMKKKGTTYFISTFIC